jgi:hypothetical protein
MVMAAMVMSAAMIVSPVGVVMAGVCTLARV